MKPQPHPQPVIVLDVGKVLVDFDERIVLEELSRRCGREINISHPSHLDELLSPVHLDTGSCGTVLQEINRVLGLSLEFGEWSDLWCRIFTGEVPGMREVLGDLEPEFCLVALSNTDEVHWRYIVREYPVFELMDGWVVSYVEGLAKPDPRIYQVVMDRYCDGGLPVFYTDDNPHYVEAARRLGWDAEVFIDAGDFKEQVRMRRAALLGVRHDCP